jgi:hypothetical protein
MDFLCALVADFRTSHFTLRPSIMLHFRAKPPFFPPRAPRPQPRALKKPLKTLAKSVSIRVNPWLKCRPEKLFKKNSKNI